MMTAVLSIPRPALGDYGQGVGGYIQAAPDLADAVKRAVARDYIVAVGSVPGASNLLVSPLAGSPISTVAPPGTYYVRVRARNGCGTGPTSNEIAIVI